MTTLTEQFMPQWRSRNTNSPWREHRLYVIVIILSLLGLMALTLTPDGTESPGNYVPLVHLGKAVQCVLADYCRKPWQAYRFIYIDFLGNIAIFIPLGIGIAGMFAKRGLRAVVAATLLLGFMTSFALEVGQLFVPSRSPDIDDLIFNSLGSLLGGLLLVKFLRKRGEN